MGSVPRRWKVALNPLDTVRLWYNMRSPLTPAQEILGIILNEVKNSQ